MCDLRLSNPPPKSRVADNRDQLAKFPTHLAAAASQFGYKLPYEGYFGGATLFSRESFQMANGYSNDYWGWGAEDDDMLARCQLAGMQVLRKRPGTYNSLYHERAIVEEQYAKNIDRIQSMLSGTLDWKNEGLNSCQYRILDRHETPETNHINVSFERICEAGADTPASVSHA